MFLDELGGDDVSRGGDADQTQRNDGVQVYDGGSRLTASLGMNIGQTVMTMMTMMMMMDRRHEHRPHSRHSGGHRHPGADTRLRRLQVPRRASASAGSREGAPSRLESPLVSHGDPGKARCHSKGPSLASRRPREGAPPRQGSARWSDGRDGTAVWRTCY